MRRKQQRHSNASNAVQEEYKRYKERLRQFNPKLEPQPYKYWREEYIAVCAIESAEEPMLIEDAHDARNYDLSTLPDAQPVRDKHKRRK